MSAAEASDRSPPGDAAAPGVDADNTRGGDKITGGAIDEAKPSAAADRERRAQAARERNVCVRAEEEWTRREARRRVDAAEAAVRRRNVDVAAIVAAGRPERIRPDLFGIEGHPDVLGLFYEDRWNRLFGPSGCGKSRLLYAALAREIAQGHHVLHLEFDGNNAEVIVWGVIDAKVPGCDPELVAEFLHVELMPTELPDVGYPIALCTIDSENAVIASLGEDLNASGTGVDRMAQTFIEPLTSTGTTVVSIDHTGHADATRERHSARKKEAITGISYQVEVVGDGGRVGDRWAARLIVRKDRPAWCGVKDGGTVAYVVFDGRAGDGSCDVHAVHDLPLDLASDVAHEGEGTDLEQVVLGIIDDTGRIPMSTAQVVKAVGDRSTDRAVRRVLTRLHQRGFIDGERRGPHRTSPWYWTTVHDLDDPIEHDLDDDIEEPET